MGIVPCILSDVQSDRGSAVFNTWLSLSPWSSTSRRQIERGERSVHGYFYGLDMGEAYISPTAVQWLGRTHLATPNCVSTVWSDNEPRKEGRWVGDGDHPKTWRDTFMQSAFDTES